jgi:hypothetical protein
MSSNELCFVEQRNAWTLRGRRIDVLFEVESDSGLNRALNALYNETFARVYVSVNRLAACNLGLLDAFDDSTTQLLLCNAKSPLIYHRRLISKSFWKVTFDIFDDDNHAATASSSSSLSSSLSSFSAVSYQFDFNDLLRQVSVLIDYLLSNNKSVTLEIVTNLLHNAMRPARCAIVELQENLDDDNTESDLSRRQWSVRLTLKPTTTINTRFVAQRRRIDEKNEAVVDERLLYLEGTRQWLPSVVRDWLDATLRTAEYRYARATTNEQLLESFRDEALQALQVDVQWTTNDDDGYWTLQLASHDRNRNIADAVQLFAAHYQQQQRNADVDDFPPFWDRSLDTARLHYVDVARGSEEWQMVSDRFTRGFRCVIERIERVQNAALWYQYVGARRALDRKNTSRREHNAPLTFADATNAADVDGSNEQLLIHGSRGTSPRSIAGNAGFHLNYANVGAQGRGIYFAYNTAYSGAGYEYSDGATRQLFVVRVSVGRAESNRNGDVKHPSTGYDSVLGNQPAIIVYDNHRAYPAYIVHYR